MRISILSKWVVSLEERKVQQCFILCVGMVFGPLVERGFAHEGTGRTGHRETPERLEVESEFYGGERGYLHGGLGVVFPMNEQHKMGLIGHFVREETGEDFFPSLGAEWSVAFDKELEVEAFSFGYFPVDDQRAWAVGIRALKSFEPREGVEVAPFFGPVFAHVRALKESTGNATTVDHWMWFGGVSITYKQFEATLFASQSLFNRDERELETHVDLEEMTHFAVYENNDGFPKNTGGIEMEYSPTEWLGLTARYAAIHFEGLPVRHSIAFAPSVKFAERWEIFGGVQLLRGGETENTLGMGGISFRF